MRIPKELAFLFLTFALCLCTTTNSKYSARRLSGSNSKSLRNSRQSPEIPALYSAPKERPEVPALYTAPKEARPEVPALYSAPENDLEYESGTTEDPSSIVTEEPSNEETEGVSEDYSGSITEDPSAGATESPVSEYLPPRAKDQQQVESTPFQHEIQIHVVPPQNAPGQSYIPQNSQMGQYLPPEVNFMGRETNDGRRPEAPSEYQMPPRRDNNQRTEGQKQPEHQSLQRGRSQEGDYAAVKPMIAQEIYSQSSPPIEYGLPQNAGFLSGSNELGTDYLPPNQQHNNQRKTSEPSSRQEYNLHLPVSSQQGYDEAHSSQQGYSAPSTQQGYSAPSTQQGYSAPSTQQGYSAPSTQQGYSAPSSQQGYDEAPRSQQEYSPPSSQQGYNSPSSQSQQGYSPPSALQSYKTVPSSQQGYNNAPSFQQGYNIPPSEQGYNNAPVSQQGYNTASSQQGYNVYPDEQGPKALPPQQGYTTSPSQQGYNVPVSSLGYGASQSPQMYDAVAQGYEGYNVSPSLTSQNMFNSLKTQQAPNSPPSHQEYNAPTLSSGFSATPSEQRYQDQPSHENYGSPSFQQGYHSEQPKVSSLPTQPHGQETDKQQTPKNQASIVPNEEFNYQTYTPEYKPTKETYNAPSQGYDRPPSEPEYNTAPRTYSSSVESYNVPPFNQEDIVQQRNIDEQYGTPSRHPDSKSSESSGFVGTPYLPPAPSSVGTGREVSNGLDDENAELEGLNGQIVDAALLHRVQLIIEEHERQQKSLFNNIQKDQNALQTGFTASYGPPQTSDMTQNNNYSPQIPNDNQIATSRLGIQYQKAVLSQHFTESEPYLPPSKNSLQKDQMPLSAALREVSAPNLNSEGTPRPIYGVPLAPPLGIDSHENYERNNDDGGFFPQPQSQNLYGRRRRRIGRVTRL